MAIHENDITNSTTVHVKLSSPYHKIVVAKRNEIRKSQTCSKEKAIKAIMKEWAELNGIKIED